MIFFVKSYSMTFIYSHDQRTIHGLVTQEYLNVVLYFSWKYNFFLVRTSMYVSSGTVIHTLSLSHTHTHTNCIARNLFTFLLKHDVCKEDKINLSRNESIHSRRSENKFLLSTKSKIYFIVSLFSLKIYVYLCVCVCVCVFLSPPK